MQWDGGGNFRRSLGLRSGAPYKATSRTSRDTLEGPDGGKDVKMLQTLFISLQTAWDENEVMGVEAGRACIAGNWTRGPPRVLPRGPPTYNVETKALCTQR